MNTMAWLFGRGEMAERISNYDWGATPLGAIPLWPQSLRAAVDLMLASSLPSSIQWGREAIFLYNDAEARILGSLHPAALGKPVADALPVVWPDREPVFRQVLSGESAILGGHRYLVRGEARESEIWADHRASPIRDETGAIAGLWMVLIDVTAGIQAERRLKEVESALRRSEARQMFLLRFSDELRAIADPAVILVTATRKTGEHFGVNRCHYGEISGGEFLPRSSWGREVASTLEGLAAGSCVASIVGDDKAGRAVVAEDIENDSRFTEEERRRLRAARTAAFVCVNLRGEAVFAVEDAVPRMWTATEVDQIREVGERTMLAARRARAEAALRDSEERFRQFAEASTDIIWIRNAKTLQLEYCSAGFGHLFGDSWDHTRDGVNLDAWLEIIVPEDRERTLDAIGQVRSGGRVAFEYCLVRPSDGAVRWQHSNVFPLLDSSGQVQRIGGICHDATAEKATADRLEMMVAELQHRTRNLMAVLQSIVARTLAASDDLSSFKRRIDERLIALSRVQHLLSRTDREPITIGALVQLELDGHMQGQAEVSGPEIRIRNSAAQLLALALHELAAEARTHGALSIAEGRLRIGWRTEQVRGVPCLQLSWIEQYPAHIAVGQDCQGYGRELIERALPYSLNAETSYELDENGLRCSIVLPLTKEGPKERGA